jgi:hypothetical protein
LRALNKKRDTERERKETGRIIVGKKEVGERVATTLCYNWSGGTGYQRWVAFFKAEQASSQRYSSPKAVSKDAVEAI